MNFKSLIFLVQIFFVLIFSSCTKKEEKTFIKGYVLIAENKQPVDNAVVNLYFQSVATGVYQGNYEKIGSYITSSNGYFEFSLEKKQYTSLKIEVLKHNFFTYQQVLNPDNVFATKTYTLTLNVHAKGWLKSIIKNQPPCSNNDNLLYILNYNYSCGECCNIVNKAFIGANVDTSWICPLYAYSNVILLWAFNNNVHSDTIHILFADTIVRYIYY
ncbi:MAG: hypothetical protein N3A01_05635 [Bacteroidales bacterium]|nr:hypothetical protein [Bacteroidales bacterium]